MSISFSQIPQIITVDEMPRGGAAGGSQNNIDPLKIKIPTLQEKFQNKAKVEEARIKESSSKLASQLETNRKMFEMEQVKQHKQLIKQKKIENYQHIKSMSDGQPHHPHDFRKMNKQIEVFKETGFLLPTIEEAKNYRKIDSELEKKRKSYLRTKAQSQIEQPFLPTKQIPNYFDNNHLMKKPEDYTQISENYIPMSYTKSARVITTKNKNQIKSLNDIPVISENHDRRSPEKGQRNGAQMTQSFVEQQYVKPTSANNLMMFQQQLQQQIEEKSQYRNSKSTTSLVSVRKTQQSVSNFSTTDAGSQYKNKQWINAYHQKEIFSRPLYNNLDIKLQGNNPHFKPFKPTKTQGYNFNKYISLEAGERDSQAANLKKMQDVNTIDFDHEPYEIKAPVKSFTRMDNY